MKWSLLDTEEETTKEIPRGEEPAVTKQDLVNQILLGNESQRFSLLQKVILVFFIVLIAGGSAAYYFRDSAFAAVVMNKYLDYRIDSALVGYWTFDGPRMNFSSSTAEILDSSGHGNNGNWINHATTTIAGKLGQAVSLDGVDDYLDMGNDASLMPSFPFTVSAWVKTTSLANGISIVTTGDVSGVGNYAGYNLGVQADGSLWIAIGSNEGCCNGAFRKTYVTSATGIVTTGQWYHVVGVYSGVLDLRIYVNGVEKSTIDSGFTNFMAYAAGSRFRVGAGYDANGATTIYNTQIIDDLRLYNRALSQNEISRLYQKPLNGVTINTSPKTIETDGLVGYWTFDGQDITGTSTVLDRSSSHATGTMVNMATSSRVMGKHGQGIDFTTAGNVNITVQNSTPLQIAQKLTISAWVKQTSRNANGALIVQKRNETQADTDYNYGLWLDSTGRLFFQSYNTGSYQNMTGTSAVPLNTWVFVTVTVDETAGTKLRFYINGELDSTPAYIGTMPSGGSAPLQIGNYGRHLDGSYQLNGTLDEVRIYNRVLSSDEIENLYNAGAGVKQGICGEGGVRDANGNVYGIVQIGSQCWLDRNMNVGTRINGASAQTNDYQYQKYCYGDVPTNCTDNHPKRPDGGLYQWNEAMQYKTTEGAQGVCPYGWHIPTDAEWYTLENYLKASSTVSCGSNRAGNGCANAGTRLMSGGDTGFEGNIAGMYYGSYGGRDTTTGAFWSSSVNGSNARGRSFVPGVPSLYRENNMIKTEAYSVRCIKGVGDPPAYESF